MKHTDNILPIHSFQNAQLNKARHHSQTIRLLRILFISLSVIIMLTLFLALVINANEVSFLPPLPKTFSTKMINPRFSGRDNSGTPFTVSADEAIQLPGSENVFELKNPRLNFNLKPTSSSQVTSDKGVYDQQANILELYENVQFKSDSGYQFITQQAHFLINENRIEGDSPVSGEGPKGQISAKGFTIDKQWNRYTFKGSVETVIQNKPE